jgi:hypothetical protein
MIDFLTLVFFSTLVSVVLTVGVIMCLICKLPLVESVFGIYTRLNGGFSFINSRAYSLLLPYLTSQIHRSNLILQSTSTCSAPSQNAK